ncbi:MAG: recombinase family protein [Hydrogenophaga sp.]|uniref:recombinase family protein n=1 Tax=Hydrogenophaga sp. TaxID=1904254 RepID=UPI001DB84E7A|nr:recombinase family protein [Hydrogenophaga sp.]MBX3609185.1 recombinase family protein [Hydrogenophaga sp.]
MAGKTAGKHGATAVCVPGGSTLACAIYTRKSSEEGLEQDFNSLHAQREACEAFVLSQKGLGWSVVTTAYDDGGFSGGNVERPALKRLIADIEAGRVQVIVVYKVDRLTRSLADFAKLVELFDARGVSFVSVTQQFNTTTSMGRLTLNVLLSFAQFEREVTGERIRDKIAASKRKGLWMGGVAPVGYRAKGRTLEPEEPYAMRVREIYQLYLQLNCVRKVATELQARGWLTPERENKRAGFGGNKPFSRGHLYRILSNPIYVGLLPHRGENHPGQHPAIVDQPLWDQVQLRLEVNRQGTRTQSNAADPSLLAGKVVDETGRRLIPSHTRKGKKRYRYYVTPPDDSGEPIRLPAGELEKLVVHAIVDWSANDKQVLGAVGWKDAKRAQEALKAAQRLGKAIQHSARAEILAGVRRIEVGPQTVRILLDLVGCGLLKEGGEGSQGGAGQGAATIEVPAKRKRCGMAVRLVIGDRLPGQGSRREPDAALVALMTNGKVWLRQFTREGLAIEEIAERERFSVRYVNRVINIALLAPDIVQGIERGEHPEDISATKLLTSVPFPEDWAAQRQALGIL